MTGRDLIIYILENNLEDEPVFKDGKLLGFMTIEEVASKWNVGPETIKAYVNLGYIQGVKIGDQLYIPAIMVKLFKGVV